MQLLHPSQALFQGDKPLPSLPVCEHYAGDEKRFLKALQLQGQLGPVMPRKHSSTRATSRKS